MWTHKQDERQYWIKWLKLYETLKCLWDNETKKKASRRGRVSAMMQLVNLSKSIYPAADVNFVRRRINGFRTCYRREFKKVEAARARGNNYKSKLFYFDTLKFLNADETITGDFGPDSGQDDFKAFLKMERSRSFTEDDSADGTGEQTDTLPNVEDESQISIEEQIEGICKEEVNISRAEMDKTTASGSHCSDEDSSSPDYDTKWNISRLSPIRKMPAQTSSQNNNRSNAAYQSTPYLQRSNLVVEDECSLVAKRIASHFKSMDTSQRLMAEKIISDVCIYGRMGKLTIESGFVLDAEQRDQAHISASPVADIEIDYENAETYIYDP